MTSQSSPALIRTSAKLFSACALLALAALTAPPLLAQDTWVGATSGNWSVGTNWLAGTAPNVGDALVFNGTSNTSTYNDLHFRGRLHPRGPRSQYDRGHHR
jgi:hypothetical protein